MIKVIQPIAGIHIPPGERDHLAVAKVAEIVCSPIHDKAWVDQFHLYHLALILERPIWLYGVMCNRSLYHDQLSMTLHKLN